MNYALAFIAASSLVTTAVEPLDTPVPPGAVYPDIAADADGASLLMIWTEPGERRTENSSASIRFSRRGADGAWSSPSTVVAGETFFTNWADFPSVVRGMDGALYGHYLRKSGPGTYAYDVVLVRSTDDGATWNNLGVAHDDGVQSEHGFVSLVPEGPGVRAFWLDGREMGGAGHGHGGGHAGGVRGAMTVRTALVGETIDRGPALDTRVCECCATAAAMTDDGPIVAFRDRSEREVRDISLVRREAGRWSEPAQVHDDGWVMPACPVNGPDLDARGRDVALAWFTAAGGRSAVLAAFSGDSGRTFGRPVMVDAVGDGAAPQGRVAVVLLPSGEAVVSWLALSEEGGAIRVKRIRADGRAGAAHTVAPMDTSRASGFPRMVRLGDTLVFAWTATGDKTGVRMASLPVDEVPAID